MTSLATGPRGRFALGLAFVAVGLLLGLDQAGVLKIIGLQRWWPLLLIAVGIVKVLQPREDGQRAIGVALLFLGGWFQLMAVGFWPMLLIAAGTLLLWQAFEKPLPPPPVDLSYVSELALLGGFKRTMASTDFKGGYITAVMGGLELDLRRTKIVTSPAYLDVVALWGGMDLKVPVDWDVEVRVVPIMGGYEDKTQAPVPSDGAPRLVVRGYAVMGGMSIGH